MAKNFEDAGFKPETRTLASFQDDYGFRLGEDDAEDEEEEFDEEDFDDEEGVEGGDGVENRFDIGR